MPRTGNRTDLLVPKVNPRPAGQPNGIPQQVQPVQAPTGLPYGEAGALQAAQHAQPLPQGGQPQPVSTQAAVQAAKQFQMPALGDLMRPSERPTEPVTAGLPGSPMSPQGPPQTPGTVTAMLSKMAQATNSGALAQLAQRAQAAGQ